MCETQQGDALERGHRVEVFQRDVRRDRDLRGGVEVDGVDGIVRIAKASLGERLATALPPAALLARGAEGNTGPKRPCTTVPAPVAGLQGPGNLAPRRNNLDCAGNMKGI